MTFAPADYEQLLGEVMNGGDRLQLPNHPEISGQANNMPDALSNNGGAKLDLLISLINVSEKLHVPGYPGIKTGLYWYKDFTYSVSYVTSGDKKQSVDVKITPPSTAILLLEGIIEDQKVLLGITRVDNGKKSHRSVDAKSLRTDLIDGKTTKPEDSSKQLQKEDLAREDPSMIWDTIEEDLDQNKSMLFRLKKHFGHSE